MIRRTAMTTLAVGLLAMFLLGGTAGSAHAQMCAMGGQGGSSGQQSMMGGGMMGQGMCPMCMMQSTATRMGEAKEPMGMMGMMGCGRRPDGRQDPGPLLQCGGRCSRPWVRLW